MKIKPFSLKRRRWQRREKKEETDGMKGENEGKKAGRV